MSGSKLTAYLILDQDQMNDMRDVMAGGRILSAFLF